MATTVFYAWQSDRNAKVCRTLIKKAAEQAIRKINADAEVKSAPPFDLDEATKGATGHPHIASLIRKKIKSCGVFLADLTHVAEYETDDGKRRKKRAQNGNVLIELGMAIRAKGFGRLILVMNDAFGPPDDLPFDLKSHSYPITYTLADASDLTAIKAARDRLAEVLATKMKPILSEIVIEHDAKLQQSSAEIEAAQREVTATKRADFEQALKNGEYFHFQKDRGYLVLSVIPLQLLAEPLDIMSISQGHPEGLRPMGRMGYSTERYGQSFITFSGTRTRYGEPDEPSSSVELRDDGKMFAVRYLGVRADLPDDRQLRFQTYERQVMDAAVNCMTLQRKLGVNGKLAVGISLLNVGRVRLLPDDNFAYDATDLRPLPQGEYRFETLMFEKADEIAVGKVAQALRRWLDILWRDAGVYRDPSFDKDGKFVEK